MSQLSLRKKNANFSTRTFLLVLNLKEITQEKFYIDHSDVMDNILHSWLFFFFLVTISHTSKSKLLKHYSINPTIRHYVASTSILHKECYGAGCREGFRASVSVIQHLFLILLFSPFVNERGHVTIFFPMSHEDSIMFSKEVFS